jgi:hypothetical protein
MSLVKYSESVGKTLFQAIKKDIDRNREKKEVTVLVLATKNDLTESRRVDHLQVLFIYYLV